MKYILVVHLKPANAVQLGSRPSCRLLMWNNHTIKAVPCISTKQTAAKTHREDQYALICYKKSIMGMYNVVTTLIA